MSAKYKNVLKCVFQSIQSDEASTTKPRDRRMRRSDVQKKCRIFLTLWKIVFVSRESFGRHIPPVSRHSDSIFLRPFCKIPDDCVRDMQRHQYVCTRCRRKGVYGRYLCVCRPILKCPLLHLILRKQMRRMYAHIRTVYTYGTNTQSLTLSLRLILHFWVTCVVG